MSSTTGNQMGASAPISIMDSEARVELRDCLFAKMESAGLLMKLRNGGYQFSRIGDIFKILDSVGLLADYSAYVAQFGSEAEARYCLMHLTDSGKHVCTCGKVCKFNSRHNYYNKTCGAKECHPPTIWTDAMKEQMKRTNRERYGHNCPLQNECIGAKARATCRLHYGCDYPLQSPQVCEKMHNINRQRYGHDYAAQSDVVKERMRSTNITKYGVEWYVQSAEMKRKSVETCQIRYGCDNPSQAESVKEKKRQTSQLHYGCDHPLQSPDIHARIRTTNRKKYGHDYPMQSQDVRRRQQLSTVENLGVEVPAKSAVVLSKMQDSCERRFGVRNPSQSPQITMKKRMLNQERHNGNNSKAEELVVALFDEQVRVADIYADDELFAQLVERMYAKKGKRLRLNELTDIFNVTPYTIKHRLATLELLHFFYINKSYFELQFAEFLDSIGVKFTRRNRMLISPMEIDFLMGNIGVEINDLCTHNITKKDRHYHLTKTIRAAESGIRLIHLWQWELSDNVIWQRVCNWLEGLLIKKETVNVADCELRAIHVDEQIAFFEKYHMCKYRHSKICYGLYKERELVQLASFCECGDNCFEMFLCAKHACDVVNGYMHLLNHFVNLHNPRSIIARCDLSKFTGSTYQRLGFRLSRREEPSVVYGSAINICNGIYDCGQDVYTFDCRKIEGGGI